MIILQDHQNHLEEKEDAVSERGQANFSPAGASVTLVPVLKHERDARASGKFKNHLVQINF